MQKLIQDENEDKQNESSIFSEKVDLSEYQCLQNQLDHETEKNCELLESLKELENVINNQKSYHENELTLKLLESERRDSEMNRKFQVELDSLKAEKFSENDFFNNTSKKGDEFLKQKHDRIICDGCFSAPIYGHRFKSVLAHESIDLCEECYYQKNRNEPFLQFKVPSNVDPRKMQDFMTYLTPLLKEFEAGTCVYIKNKGLSDDNK